MTQRIYKVKNNIKSRQTNQDTALAIDMDSGDLIEFNDTGFAIFSLLDGTRSVRTICDQLASEYDATAETIEPNVIAVIEKLKQSDFLLEVM